MPLVNLQTNLKSLSFGRDRPDLGSSNQPYITADIPGNNEPIPENPLENEDFLLRGGIDAVEDTFEDVERLFRYFKDLQSPSGLLFTAKQNLLSKIAVRTQASGVGINEGVYTPLNTLAQAGIIAFGGHIPKQGIIPIAGAATYTDQFRRQLTQVAIGENIPSDVPLNSEVEVIGGDNGIGNRLVQLAGVKIDNSLKFKRKFKRKNQIARNENNILSYSGGPNSAVGIGRTTIRFAQDPYGNPLRTGENNPKLTTPGLLQGMPSGEIPQSPLFFFARKQPATPTLDADGIKESRYYNYIARGYFSIGGVSSILDSWSGVNGDFNDFGFNRDGLVNSDNKHGDIEAFIDVNAISQGDGSYEVSNKVQNRFKTSVYKEDKNLYSEDFMVPVDGWTNSDGTKYRIRNKFVPITPSSELNETASPLRLSGVYDFVQGELGNKSDILNNSGIDLKFGQGYYNTTNPSVYKLGTPIGLYPNGRPTLDPIDNLSTYQTGFRYSLSNQFISPLGATKKYNKSSLSTLIPTSIFSGSLTWLPNFETNVYKKGLGVGDFFSSTKKIYFTDSFTGMESQYALTYDETRDKSNSDPESDFRSILIKKNFLKTHGSSTISISPDYNKATNKSIEGPVDSRINYASPGQVGNIISYTKGKINTLGKVNITDRINALPLYRSSAVAATEEGDAGGTKNDLVKFRIASIDTNNPSRKTYTHFRAYIDSFSDSYNATWNKQKYMGRGEAFYKYDNFDRQINMSFTVAAQSKPEIMVMYRKLNYLASNLAPEYTSAGYMAGSLVQLTMGGWCYELPGFINSLTLDVPQESPWEIGINDEGTFDNTVKEMPHIIKVTGLTFTPIHTFRPAKMKLTKAMTKPDSNLADNNKYGNERYIALKAGNNNYDNEVNWYTKPVQTFTDAATFYNVVGGSTGNLDEGPNP